MHKRSFQLRQWKLEREYEECGQHCEELNNRCFDDDRYEDCGARRGSILWKMRRVTEVSCQHVKGR